MVSPEVHELLVSFPSDAVAIQRRGPTHLQRVFLSVESECFVS
jgi:hypothetical protein